MIIMHLGGHRNSEYSTIQENIDAVKELIDKYEKKK